MSFHRAHADTFFFFVKERKTVVLEREIEQHVQATGKRSNDVTLDLSIQWWR